MQAVSVTKPIYYDKKRDTIFPCEHDPEDIKTRGRCTVCRMPVKKTGIKLDLMNTTAVFCCNECKIHYQKSLIKIKVVNKI
jgi:CRISPR/Cas system-associated protein Cas10 (large subunit of type III CRISPR-Cas system)